MCLHVYSPLQKQSWCVSAVLVNMVAQGMLLSYTSSLLPALRDAAPPLRTDIETASWISSSIGFAGILGLFISSVLMEIFGRRITHIVVTIPGAVGWLLIYFASNIPCIMWGRVLGGVTAGATVSLGAIVIGEYSAPAYRGMMLNLKTTAVCVGGMAVHLLAHYCSWRTIALISIVPYLIAILITLTWPESPAWLAKTKQFEISEEAFFWLRGDSLASRNEFEQLIRARSRITRPQGTRSFNQKLKGFFKKFIRKDFLKPVSISILGVMLLEASGRHFFQAYALAIMVEVTGNKTNSFLFTLCIDLIIVCSTLFSSVLVRLAKRRTLLFSTGFASLAVLMTVCVYLFFEARGFISRDYNLIPICMFVVYFILVNLGCTTIPLALLGEVFPLEHRGSGSAVSGVVLYSCLALGLKLTPILMLNVKVYGTFGVFGAVMCVTLLALYCTLPETKDRTLQEIEDHFNGKHTHHNNNEHQELSVKLVKP